MMFWSSKKRPNPPPIEQEREFVEWLLRYGKEFEVFRQIYRRNVDKYVQINADAISKELVDHPDHDRLSERHGAMAEFYVERFMPIVKKRGGIQSMEPQLQAHTVMLLTKLQALLYILKYKYKDTLTIAQESVCGPLEDLYSK